MDLLHIRTLGKKSIDTVTESEKAFKLTGFYKLEPLDVHDFSRTFATHFQGLSWTVFRTLNG